MNEQKNAPEAVAPAVEGVNQKPAEGSVTYIVTDPRSPRHGWTVRVGPDYPEDVYYEENRRGTDLLRVHYRITRSAEHRSYVLRHLRDSTDADRAKAMEKFADLHTTFDDWERVVGAHRVRRPNGRYLFIIRAGTIVDDPLIQLELEMMIDLESGVRS